MKVSFNWLCEYVDLEGLTAHQVAEKLTMGAFEVEEVTVFGADLEGPIVVGEIMEIHQHPNADKIRLTKTRVKAGEEPLEIVCGAQNIEVGQIIPVALPGAKCINRHDGSALPIKASAIRGVKSNGMLCSAAELGIPTDDSTGEGILILGTKDTEHPELGQDARKLLKIEPDYILHVEPRSNRGDALSVAGLAREVAALFNRGLKKPEWDWQSLPKGETNEFSTKTTEIENIDDCPYISLIPISGIKVGPAPALIAKRLESIGMRSVNNVVDITNYVMHELGQPLHAYCKDKLKADKVSVRRAKDGDKITTLDDKERVLPGEALLIVDGQTPAGVAGIMGGKDSEIDDNSTSILLEAACFTPSVVRRGSRLLGLSSDASLRFERGIDAPSVLNASKRAVYLLVKYCGTADTRVGEPLIAGSDQAKEVSVPLRKKAIKRILDLDMDGQRVGELLTPLGFTVKMEDTENFSVSIPSFRQNDVKREIDLIEEVCRLNGYDAIASTMPRSTLCAEAPDNTESKARTTLAGLGLSEAWLSSLVPESEEGMVESHLVQVLNPLSKDHQRLRQSLVPGLVNALVYNQDRGRKDVRLYELGRVYWKESADNQNGDQNKNGKAEAKGYTGVDERHLLGGLITGNSREGTDYYAAKGLVETLLANLSINQSAQKLSWISAHKFLSPWLHPYRTAVIALNRPPKKGSDLTESTGVFGNPMVLGYVGEIHPAYANRHGLKETAYVFELDLDRLKNERKAPKFTEIPQTPAMTRDLTLDFAPDKTAEHQSIARLIADKGGANLRASDLVGIYQPPKDKDETSAKPVSLTYRLTFQHATETLTTEEIDKVVEVLRESLRKELGASFRI